MIQDVKINTIVTEKLSHSDVEFICIVNKSKAAFTLEDWRLEYQNGIGGSILHTHKFGKLSNGLLFRPGCCLHLITGPGFNGHMRYRQFSNGALETYTRTDTRIFNDPEARVTLFDGNDVIDSLSVVKYHTSQYLQQIATTHSVISKPVIFIGHGGHPDWRDLKDHLQDKHKFECVYFEVEERAGMTVTDVIAILGKTPNLALLVLTAEDEMKTGTMQARQNVIHELGLFQKHLGSNRAIPLVEKDVVVPSNISGIQEIRFDKGRIRETYGDVLAVLRREFELY